MSIYKTIILLFITIGFGSVYAQDNYVVAYGKLKVEWGDTENTSITLYEDNKEIDVYYPQKNGKFQFTLELNHMYLFWFEKPGYVTKKVQFNTAVPESVTSDPEFIPFPDFDFYVTLFEVYPEVDTMFFTKPVGKIQYGAAKNDFAWDKNYTLEIQRSMEQIEKEIIAKHDQKIKEKEDNEKLAQQKAVEAEEARKETEKLAVLEKEREEKLEKQRLRAETEAQKQAELEKQQQEKEAIRQAEIEEDKQAEKDRKQAALQEDKKKKEKEELEQAEKKAKKLANEPAQQQKEEENKEPTTAKNKVLPDNPVTKEEAEPTMPKPQITVKEDKELIEPAIIKEPNNSTSKKKTVAKKNIVNTLPRVSKIDKVEVAGKTTTRSTIIDDGITLVFIKVEYTWGGKFFFIEDENNQYRNISEQYYIRMTSKK